MKKQLFLTFIAILALTSKTYCSQKQEAHSEAYANQEDNSELKRKVLKVLIEHGMKCWNEQRYMQYKQALEYFAPVAAQNTFLDLKASGLNELGDTYEALGDYKTAIECYKMAEQYTAEQAGKEAYAHAKFNLGSYYLAGPLKDYELARSLLEAALVYKQELSLNNQAHLASNLGFIELEGGHYKKAEFYFQQAAQQTDNNFVREKAQQKLEEIKLILAQATEQKESKQQTKQPEQTTGTTTSSTAPQTYSAQGSSVGQAQAASSSAAVTSTASASTTAATEQSFGSPAVALA